MQGCHVDDAITENAEPNCTAIRARSHDLNIAVSRWISRSCSRILRLLMACHVISVVYDGVERTSLCLLDSDAGDV
jgi:hypothetical protein